MPEVINTDIYNIVQTVDDLKQSFIEDESEQTLAIGIYGFMGAVQSKKIQQSIRIASELANEVFPCRAKFPRNVITHAIMENITDINAKPAEIQILLGIRYKDLLDNLANDIFTLDKNAIITVGDYEYHLVYDIVLTKTSVVSSSDIPIYTARYDIVREDPTTTITNPYLSSPVTLMIDNETYIFMSCQIKQIHYDPVYKKMISSNVIDNKTIVFKFEDQLAYFEVKVTNSEGSIYLTPVFEGNIIPNGVTHYCWYTYIDEDQIRIKFERNSYIPSINSEIYIDLYTTKGDECNFPYSNSIYIDIDSSAYGYKSITGMIKPQTDSQNGKNRKTIDELKKLLPKENLSRGNITSMADLNNYFNVLNSDFSKLVVQPKIDNQKERSFYTYLVMKDSSLNVIPANTISLYIDTEKDILNGLLVDNGETSAYKKRYILPAGSMIVYDVSDEYGICVDSSKYLDPVQSESDILTTYPLYNADNTADVGDMVRVSTTADLYIVEYNSSTNTKEWVRTDKFVYSTIFNMIINYSPLYSAFYLNRLSRNPYLYFDYINASSKIQFISESVHWERKFLTDTNKYKLNITCTQNTNVDMGIVVRHTEDGNIVVDELNLRIFAVFYREGVAYRYKEMSPDYLSIDYSVFKFEFNMLLETDDIYDEDNNVKITNLSEILKTEGTSDINYGFLEPNTTISIYICAKFPEEYGRRDLDSIVPNLTGWTVTNVYEVVDGIDFFENYSEISITKVTPIREDNEDGTSYRTGYRMKGVPLISWDFSRDEDNMSTIIDTMNYEKAYIENAIKTLENSFGIDFKLFNTYGPSKTYTIDIGNGKLDYIDRVNITLHFKLKLVSNSDSYTKQYILDDIKSYLEDLDELGSIHIPNLIASITNSYRSSIVYIEFVGINNYGPGAQHLYVDDEIGIDTTPEFICMNPVEDASGNTIPDIRITIIP